MSARGIPGRRIRDTPSAPHFDTPLVRPTVPATSVVEPVETSFADLETQSQRRDVASVGTRSTDAHEQRMRAITGTLSRWSAST